MIQKDKIGIWLNSHLLQGQGLIAGVEDGSFAQQILQSWHGQKLYLVDPWDLVKEHACDIKSNTNEKNKNNYQKTLNVVSEYKNKTEVLKAHLYDIINNFSDNSLDFVYLNLNKKFHDLWQDIKFWYSKVKSGGLLCGSHLADGIFFDPKTKEYVGDIQVKSAVNKFCVDNSLEFTVGTCSSWYIRKPKKYNIAFVSVYDKKYKYLYDLTNKNKNDYCDKHGYDCKFYSFENPDSTKHAAYSKFLAVLDCLPYYDWVFYSDIDSIIMNHEIKIEDFIDENYDLFVTYDINSLNNGQFLVRNTPRTLNFLSRSYVDKTVDSKGSWSDQISFSANLASDGKLLSRTKVLPQSAFNSYIPMNMMFTDGTNAPAFKYPNPYKQGDFLIHLVGMSEQDRTNLIMDYSRKVNYGESQKRPNKRLLTQVDGAIYEINTPDYGSFNPAIIPLHDIKICVYRRDEESLVACMLDDKYKVIKNSVFKLQTPRAADPRLIWTPDKKLLMTYSTFEINMDEEYVVGQIIMEKRDGKFVNNKPFRISPESIGTRQKNWIPFVSNNIIYFISDIHPHTIWGLRGYADDSAELLYESKWNNIWFVNNQMRGSTNPVQLEDGNFISTFHTSQLINSVHHYDNGCYIFSGKPPFQVIKCSNRTFMPAESASTKHFRKEGHIQCIFPSSMFFEGDKAVIAYGDNDSACKVLETTKNELLKTLNNID